MRRYGRSHKRVVIGLLTQRGGDRRCLRSPGRAVRIRRGLPPRRAGDTVVVDFRQRLPLARGTYSVTTALAYDRSQPKYFDWVDNALVLNVLPPESGKVVHGKVGLTVDIAVHVQ